MQPIWARKFEPPAVAGDESQEAPETLMEIHRVTGDAKYLKPIPAALGWLKRSLLADGQLARYYELKTNRPLYMVRRGDTYTLTYDDSDLPKHYGWKFESRLSEIEKNYEECRSGARPANPPLSLADLARQAREILSNLDSSARWQSTYEGERLVGQPKFALGAQYLSSEVFSQNISTLSDFLVAASTQDREQQSRLRTWTDRSGRFSVDAEFVGITADSVQLRRADGQVISVMIDKLSDRDRGYLDRKNKGDGAHLPRAAPTNLRPVPRASHQ
jgi:hypothetical protein